MAQMRFDYLPIDKQEEFARDARGLMSPAELAAKYGLHVETARKHRRRIRREGQKEGSK